LNNTRYRVGIICERIDDIRNIVSIIGKDEAHKISCVSTKREEDLDLIFKNKKINMVVISCGIENKLATLIKSIETKKEVIYVVPPFCFSLEELEIAHEYVQKFKYNQLSHLSVRKLREIVVGSTERYSLISKKINNALCQRTQSVVLEYFAKVPNLKISHPFKITDDIFKYCYDAFDVTNFMLESEIKKIRIIDVSNLHLVVKIEHDEGSVVIVKIISTSCGEFFNRISVRKGTTKYTASNYQELRKRISPSVTTLYKTKVPDFGVENLIGKITRAGTTKNSCGVTSWNQIVITNLMVFRVKEQLEKIFKDGGISVDKKEREIAQVWG
jgi:hypothetical protein